MNHEDIFLSRQKHIRDDGWLCELVSMNYPDEPFTDVHSYIVSIKPGKTRANHYHMKKKEWIGIAAGKVVLILKWIDAGDYEEILLDAGSEEYSLIYIPPGVAHSIKNISDDDSVIIVFSRTPEDKDDTIPFEVNK